MAMVQMFNSGAAADGWHRVQAPGGYEWWYFDAEQTDGDLRLVVIFFQGFVFHPGYLRRYARYHRHPTRHAPPVPAEYPCVYFVLYRGDQIVAQLMTQHEPDAFAAATDRAEVTIGGNRLSTGADGVLRLEVSGIPWQLTSRGPRFLKSQMLSASLSFTPQLPHAAMERTFISRESSGADHRWVIANPLCGVAGVIELTEAGQSARRFEFSGRGYHDHNYGTGPIGPGLSRWMWGRVLMDGHVMAFHLVETGLDDQPVQVHLLESDQMGTRELAADGVRIDWSRHTPLWLSFPDHLQLGPLRLMSPVVIDSTPFYLRLAYRASVRGQAATAFCEIAYPHRLRWPVLGRMIEMSILQQPNHAQR